MEQYVKLNVKWLLVICTLYISQSCNVEDQEQRIWDHDNLVAWEAAPLDTKQRTPEERAIMLKELGFKHYAYLSSTRSSDEKVDVNNSQHDFIAEIDAMVKHGVNIYAWYFWMNTDDPRKMPKMKATFEAFKKYEIHPNIWITNSYEEGYLDFPKTPEAYEERVEKEAKRIKAVVDLASVYGCKVNLYNHRAWFGIIDNQIAILKKLESMGVKDVGLVYNFSHSRDWRNPNHNDPKNFPELWVKMKPYVSAVNVVGLSEKRGVYPSEGIYELEMMRIIEESGWEGPIGALVIRRADTAEELLKVRKGIDWLAAEINEPGSGGDKPKLRTEEL